MFCYGTYLVEGLAPKRIYGGFRIVCMREEGLALEIFNSIEHGASIDPGERTVVLGPGAYSMNTWSGRGRDEETALLPATFNTRRAIRKIGLLDKVEAPLGWSGKWYSQANPDGTWTHRLVTRMLDIDQEKGEILRTVDRLKLLLVLK